MKLNTSDIPDIVIDDLKVTIEKAIFPNQVFLFADKEKISIDLDGEHPQVEKDRLNAIIQNAVQEYFAE